MAGYKEQHNSAAMQREVSRRHHLQQELDTIHRELAKTNLQGLEARINKLRQARQDLERSLPEPSPPPEKKELHAKLLQLREERITLEAQLATLKAAQGMTVD